MKPLQRKSGAVCNNSSAKAFHGWQIEVGKSIYHCKRFQVRVSWHGLKNQRRKGYSNGWIASFMSRGKLWFSCTEKNAYIIGMAVEDSFRK